jgi:hypothetical protein
MLRKFVAFGAGGFLAAAQFAVVGLLAVPLNGCCLLWGWFPICGNSCMAASAFLR